MALFIDSDLIDSVIDPIKNKSLDEINIKFIIPFVIVITFILVVYSL